MRVAVRHVLGFTKVPLVPFGPWRVALHWWPGGQAYREDIHSHRWGFVSFVLFGAVLECRYQQVAGDDFGLYRCYPGCRPGGEVEGMCSFAPSEIVCHRVPWRPYTGEAGGFHHAWAQGRSVTLFVQRRRGELPWSLAAVRGHSPGREP